jgi:peptide/nickel transport system substrate-binding protein
MNKKVLALALAFFLLLPVIFPSVKALDQPLTVPNWDHIIYTTIGNLETCDPAWSYDIDSSELIWNVYDTLIGFCCESTSDFEPRIADSWAIEAGPNGPNTIYTFTIKSGIKWHASDGPFGMPEPLNYNFVKASDVEYSFERCMVLDHVGGPQWMLYWPLLNVYTSEELIKKYGGDVAAAGQAIDNAITSDDIAGTLTFNLTLPYAPFMQILTQSLGSVLPKQYGIDLYNQGRSVWPGWELGGGYTGWLNFNDPIQGYSASPMQIDAEGNFAPVMLGSGPYKFVDWIIDDYWEITRFADYFKGWPAPDCADYVSEVTVKFEPSWTKRKTMFLSGEADSVVVPRAYISEVESQPGVRCCKGLPSLTLGACAFNFQVNITSPFKPTLAGVTKLDLFSDMHLRKGFAHSLNYAKYIIDLYGGEAEQPSSALIRGLGFFNGSKPLYNYDLNLAKWHFMMAYGGTDADGNLETLNDVNPGTAWTKGFTTPLVLAVSSTAGRNLLMEMLKKAIEVDITGWDVAPTLTITSLSWRDYMDALYAKELPFYTIGWLSDWADPASNVRGFWHSEGELPRWQSINWSQIRAGDFHPSSGRQYNATHWWNHEGNLVSSITNAQIDDLVALGEQLIGEARRPVYEYLVDLWYAEMPTMTATQPLERHWERQWVQGWYYNPSYPGYYFYHLWKGLDTDMTGRDPTESSNDTPAPYGCVNIKDKGELNAYWWDGFTTGILGYNRVADVWWMGRAAADCREMNGQSYLTGQSPAPPESSWYAFGIPAGADGFVDIYDKARLSFEWHNWVQPNP